jgi:hypothetical protein
MEAGRGRDRPKFTGRATPPLSVGLHVHIRTTTADATTALRLPSEDGHRVLRPLQQLVSSNNAKAF